MKRNKFSLSHYRLMSFKMGNIYPCACIEVLPGDTFQHATKMLLRCAPLLAPVMHPVHVRIHHWFVPHRLVWDNWQNFITGGPDGLNASVFPTMTLTDADSTVRHLPNYFGIPSCATGGSMVVSALPFRAYQLIFNEWYRDQDLTTPVALSKADGVDTTTSRALEPVAWEKDYFTTARPWTAKGPNVTIPLTPTTAPITGIGVVDGTATNAVAANVRQTSGSLMTGQSTPASNAALKVLTTGNTGSGNPIQVFADLSNVKASDINNIRLAFALQRYEEARARYGSRYTEYLRYLGVRSSDARLQRPEYLGGGKQTIQFSEVLQTGVTTSGQSPGVGNMAGHGIAALGSNRYRRFFEEHGYVLSLLSVRPRTIYAQSLPRTFNRRVKEDFWQRELQHIGQQAILNKEVYADGLTGTPDGTFGYQDRYDEYRRQESNVAGDFRNTILNYWHMARIFASEPTLNSSFVVSNPTNRIFADQTGNDTLLAMVSHSVQARRLVARTGTSFIY